MPDLTIANQDGADVTLSSLWSPPDRKGAIIFFCEPTSTRPGPPPSSPLPLWPLAHSSHLPLALLGAAFS